jgi:hypothetical protein
MLDELISFHALLEKDSGDDEATFVQKLHYFFASITSNLLLLGTGLVGLAGFRRKFKK